MRPPMLKGLKMKQIEGKKGTNSAKMLFLGTMAKTEIIYPKNVVASVEMNFTYSSN